MHVDWSGKRRIGGFIVFLLDKCQQEIQQTVKALIVYIMRWDEKFLYESSFSLSFIIFYFLFVSFSFFTFFFFFFFILVFVIISFNYYFYSTFFYMFHIFSYITTILEILFLHYICLTRHKEILLLWSFLFFLSIIFSINQL